MKAKATDLPPKHVPFSVRPVKTATAERESFKSGAGTPMIVQTPWLRLQESQAAT